MRVAVRGFLVNYVLANEDGYHHAGDNHRASQRVEHYGHRSVFTQLTRQSVVRLRNIRMYLLLFIKRRMTC